MATWIELCRENLEAAGELVRLGMHRSSVSRAYYAAFAAVSHVLTERGVTFPTDRLAPSHEGLRTMVKQNLGGVPIRRRRRLVSRLNALYQRRLQADYRPDVCIDAAAARDPIGWATSVVAAVGVRA